MTLVDLDQLHYLSEYDSGLLPHKQQDQHLSHQVCSGETVALCAAL
mgnify:CR=1 FL=1